MREEKEADFSTNRFGGFLFGIFGGYKYPSYNDACYGFNHLALLFDGKKTTSEANKAVFDGFMKLIGDIQKDKSHVTLKIRQAINFNDENGVVFNRMEVNSLKILNNSKKVLFNDENQLTQGHNYVLHLDVLKENYGTGNIHLELLPPPIFYVDILFRQKNSNDYTSLSVLSSGEKQMLYSTSAIIYHLRNIESVPKSGNTLIKYNNVNIILEEIELYFHPEFQKRFIKYLIDTINKSISDAKMNINIIFVTHSPFILSDIPKQNVLFLKEGIPNYDMQENTFGANIHSILKNGFFLETLPIGAFAHHKINEMFRKLNSGYFDDTQYKNMYQDILLVGEPFLRGQLLGLYNSYKVQDISDTLENKYLERIEKLEQEMISIRASNSKTNIDDRTEWQ